MGPKTKGRGEEMESYNQQKWWLLGVALVSIGQLSMAVSYFFVEGLISLAGILAYLAFGILGLVMRKQYKATGGRMGELAKDGRLLLLLASIIMFSDALLVTLRIYFF